MSCRRHFVKSHYQSYLHDESSKVIHIHITYTLGQGSTGHVIKCYIKVTMRSSKFKNAQNHKTIKREYESGHFKHFKNLRPQRLQNVNTPFFSMVCISTIIIIIMITITTIIIMIIITKIIMIMIIIFIIIIMIIIYSSS